MADDKQPIPFPDRGESRPEPPTAQEMLRAFEDKHLGADVSRIDGAIEKGHGAKFHGLSDHQKAHHGALVKLVGTESALTAAHADLRKAADAHAAAQAVVNLHASAD